MSTSKLQPSGRSMQRDDVSLTFLCSSKQCALQHQLPRFVHVSVAAYSIGSCTTHSACSEPAVDHLPVVAPLLLLLLVLLG
jgi:hypothetical protein